MATAIQAPAEAAGPTSHTQNQPAAGYTREQQEAILRQLRKPFEPEEILQRPAIICDACESSHPKVCSNHHMVKCSGCGQTVTDAHEDLSYVGHAEATERLLTVDPFWDWEPLATDTRGMPQLDEFGGMWIRLTVGGMSRLGYGDAGKGKPRDTTAVKQLIGNAIRNAGMRFGMALDLWKKSDQSRAVAVDRIAVGMSTAPDFRLKQLADWTRTYWGQTDKLTAIRGWATAEGFTTSLVPGPDGLAALGDLLDRQITALQQDPDSVPPADQPAPAGEEPQQDPAAPAPDPEPDPPHQDEPGEEDELTRMEARIYLHWDKKLLLEQDRTEVRRLDLQDRNVEGPPQWNGAWMRFEALIDRRLAELNRESNDTERSAA